jgi:hypothetical protein
MAEEKDAGKTENKKDYRRGLRMFMRLFEPETQIFLDALHAWECSETKPAQTKNMRVVFLYPGHKQQRHGSGSSGGGGMQRGCTRSSDERGDHAKSISLQTFCFKLSHWGRADEGQLFKVQNSGRVTWSQGALHLSHFFSLLQRV